MADIQIQCGNCGSTFDVSEDAAGLIAQCPQCSHEVRIPLPAGGAAGVGKLQVKRDHVITGGKRCPACDATMSDDAVICIHCGFDTRTGLRLETDNPRARMFQMVAKILGVLVVVAGAWFALKWYSSRWATLPEPMPPPVAAPAAAPEEVVAPAAPTTTMVAAGLVVTQSVVVTQSQASATGSATNMTPEELALMEARYLESVTRQTDQYYPFYSVGSTVVIRRVTGLVHRGTIKEFRKESVLLDSDGSAMEVPLATLDQASRLQCDQQFRAQFIAFQVRKRMQNVDRL